MNDVPRETICLNLEVGISRLEFEDWNLKIGISKIENCV